MSLFWRTKSVPWHTFVWLSMGLSVCLPVSVSVHLSLSVCLSLCGILCVSGIEPWLSRTYVASSWYRMKIKITAHQSCICCVYTQCTCPSVYVCVSVSLSLCPALSPTYPAVTVPSWFKMKISIAAQQSCVSVCLSICLSASAHLYACVQIRVFTNTSADALYIILSLSKKCFNRNADVPDWDIRCWKWCDHCFTGHTFNVTKQRGALSHTHKPVSPSHVFLYRVHNLLCFSLIRFFEVVWGTWKLWNCSW